LITNDLHGGDWAGFIRKSSIFDLREKKTIFFSLNPFGEGFRLEISAPESYGYNSGTEN